MIVADTNVWIAYLAGAEGVEVFSLGAAIDTQTTRMIPMVLYELLSFPALSSEQTIALTSLPLLSLRSDFWVQVGLLRASLQTKGYRPRLVDTMIAQVCLDHSATLLTRDAGFNRFVDAGLKIHK